MIDSEDWEVRHTSTPFYVHLISGSLAGISEHLSMLPLDNIKTHCQAGRNMSIWEITKAIYKSGGLKNFYSGSSVVAAGCVPAHGLYFSIYQFTKNLFGLDQPHQANSNYLYTIVGATSSLFHDFILTPTEAIKQRLQLLRTENSHIKIRKVIKTMIKTEGLKSFYRSFGINYFMTVPFGAIMVTFNETLKQKVIPLEQENLLKYYLCAGLAGFIACVPTCPLDVIKTKLNTQNCLATICEKEKICSILKRNVGYQNKVVSHHHYRDRGNMIPLKHALSTQKFLPLQHFIGLKYPTIRETIKVVYREEGLAGFFKGLKMRILIQAPSSAIAWGTYQTFKRLLLKPTHQ